jgi:hypothetical protein
MTTKPTSPDPLEGARKVLNAPAPSLADLEDAAAALSQVRDETDVEISGMAARRREILAADAPAAEIDKRLEKHDETVRALTRRNEIAAAGSTHLVTRIAAEREVERAAKQRADYEAVLARRSAFVRRAEELLGRVGPESRDLIGEYAQVEQAIGAANRRLPPGFDPIPSVEVARQGNIPAPKVTERRYQVFVYGREVVDEVGKCEAYPSGNGLWTVYRRSAAIQGDFTVGPCVIAEFVEITTQRYEPVRLEALAGSLRVPPFLAPIPALGRPERRTMPAYEWAALSAQPDPLAAAAE